ncbi:uncharacterized protein LOC127278869 [Leptopilina boulardi]|uniref:uncharacterized protein LOC127278869 n=1 Tax=Leptopilina boulardi TaxID=63433 RepID=UPI0021F653B3|nr:uncharacterized protein LOC127278869 [Leptopilina boulardi]
MNREKSNVDIGESLEVEENVRLLEEKVENLSLEEGVICEGSEHLCNNCTEEAQDEEIVTDKERDAFLMLHFNENSFMKSSVQFNLESDINSGKQFKDKATQVCTDDFTFSFISLINSDKVLNTLTGIPTLSLLEALVESAKKVWPNRRHGKHVLSLKESIVLTMLKIKQDLSYSMFFALFQKVGRHTCSRVFNTTVLLLSTILTPIVARWPSREEIDNNNLPNYFHEFKPTRVVLDCTETPIEKSKCLRCRVRCYSQYKSTFTVKVLVGVTPAGLISYVSPTYGGRASDKQIFTDSELLNCITGGTDAVMVDKGFLIESLCVRHDIQLFRPPFMHDNQLNHDEAQFCKKIAAARVHVERVNQRIKFVKMVRSQFAWNLFDYMDHIFRIACALVNLSAPVLAENNF